MTSQAENPIPDQTETFEGYVIDGGCIRKNP